MSAWAFLPILGDLLHHSADSGAWMVQGEEEQIPVGFFSLPCDHPELICDQLLL